MIHVPAALASLPDHRGQVLSGERWKRIRLMAGGRQVERLVGDRRPVDPRLKAVIEALDRLVESTLGHPRRAFQLAVLEATRAEGGELTATLSFTAVGDDRQLGFVAAGPADRALTLYWWPHRAGVPKADVQAVHAVSVSPVPAANPAAFATYRIRTRIDASAAAPIAVQLQYSNLGAAPSAAGTWQGLLFSEPVVVR